MMQQKLRPDDELRPLLKAPPAKSGQLSVKGISGLHTKMALCCNPIPPEPIMGYITRGRGITIHTKDCKQLMATKEPERWIDVQWGSDEKTFPIPIIVTAYRRPGLIDHLQGQAAVPDIIQTTGVELLEFIACGTRHHGGPELLGSPPMRDLLSTLRARYQAIIVDSAPMAGAIDPFVLGAATGTLLLILRTGYTDRRVTAAKLGVLDRLPIRPLGVVLNDVREAGAYRLYSYYLPGYTSDDEDGARRSLPGTLTL